MTLQAVSFLVLSCCLMGCSVARLVAGRTAERSPERQELATALREQQEMERDLISRQEAQDKAVAAANGGIASRIQVLSAMKQQPQATARSESGDSQKRPILQAVSHPSESASTRRAAEHDEESMIGQQSPIQCIVKPEI